MKNTFVNNLLNDLVPQLEALTPYKPTDRKKGKGNDKGWYTLALETTRLLKATYPDDRPELERQYGTCLRQITELKRRLKSEGVGMLGDKQNKFPYLTVCKHFGEFLSSQFAQYKTTQNIAYRENVDTRSREENRVELALTEHLEFAHEVLKTPREFTWLDLSCALALCTGRRMAEIHMSAEFTPIEGESHMVSFRGQIKGKARKIQRVPLHQHTFQIPTLVPAQLVIDGLNELGAWEKRLDYSHSWTYEKVTQHTPRVNRRYSKDLNKLTKAEEWAVIEAMTYHKFRGAYFRAAIENESGNVQDYQRFASRVLGDRDQSTINSYQRFDIAPGSLTRID